MIMSKLNKSFFIASIATVLFLLMTVFSSSSAFNLLPYMLHEDFILTSISETNFIIGFDIIFSILLFFVVYKVSDRILARKSG